MLNCSSWLVKCFWVIFFFFWYISCYHLSMICTMEALCKILISMPVCTWNDTWDRLMNGLKQGQINYIRTRKNSWHFSLHYNTRTLSNLIINLKIFLIKQDILQTDWNIVCMIYFYWFINFFCHILLKLVWLFDCEFCVQNSITAPPTALSQ